MPAQTLPAIVQGSRQPRCSPAPNQSNGRICSGWPLCPSEVAARFPSAERKSQGLGHGTAGRYFAQAL